MLKHLLSRRLAYFMKFAGAWRSQWLRARNGKTFFTLMLSLSSELLPLDQKVFLGSGQKRTFVCGDYRGFPSRQKERSRYYQWRMAGKIEISVKRSYFWCEKEVVISRGDQSEARGVPCHWPCSCRVCPGWDPPENAVTVH